MSYEIDVYENITIDEIDEILQAIDFYSQDKDTALLTLDLPYGFAVLIEEYIFQRKITYPITYRIPSDIKYIPVVCIETQSLVLRDEKDALYAVRLDDFRTRYNKILLRFKTINKWEEDNIKEVLSILGFVYYSKNAEKEYIVSIDNKHLAEKNFDLFSLTLIDSVFIR